MKRDALNESSPAIKIIEVDGVQFEVLATHRKSGTTIARTKFFGTSYAVGYITKRCQAYGSWSSFDCAVEVFDKECSDFAKNTVIA